jgi:methionine-rich copper-binding protein CopC
MSFRLPALFAAAALTLAAPALAHVKVASSTPAEGSTVAAPKTVVLNFSDTLLPTKTGVELVMTAMPGHANHGIMPIKNFVPAWSNGNRTLTLNLRQPLRTGTYEARWQSTGGDGHKMAGKVTFVVK